MRVASGIISVDRFGADEVSALYAGLQGLTPVASWSGSAALTGPRPADPDQLPRSAGSSAGDGRVMAALGPKMLDLARRRAAGAFPVLVTPGYTASARSLVGEDPRWPLSNLSWSAPTPSGRGRSRAARSDSSAKFQPTTRPASAGWGLPARRSTS